MTRLLVWIWLGLQVGVAQTQPAGSAEQHLKQAAVYQQNGDLKNAARELRQALEIQPDLRDAHGMLGEILLAQDFPGEALPHLERAGHVYAQGLALLELNRVPEAVGKLLAVNAQRPNDPAVLFALGEASAKLMQQSFTRLARLHPDSPQTLELQARNYMAQGRADLAEPLFRKALKLNPSLSGVHLDLGRILQEQRGDLDGAEQEFRAEAGLRPGNSEAAWRLGSVLLKKGQGKEALPWLEQSEKLKPDMLDTLLDLGKAYLSDNRTAEAERAFRRIIEINDSGEMAAAAHLQLSQIYRKLGKTAEAEQHLKRFRELAKNANPQ